MKQLKCEMCNSIDLIKQDGVFVCQYCGCKYSVEEARKMMIEGTVNVSGSTVKVDNSGFVQKSLANARRAKNKTDWEEVERYYNLVEQNEPQNIEAVFYSSYGKVMLSLTDSDRFKREQKFEVFGRSISIIDDYYDPQKSDELIPTIKMMSEDLIRLNSSNYVYNKTKNSSDSGITLDLMATTEMLFIETLENIIRKEKDIVLFHILRCHYERIITNERVKNELREQYIKKLEECNNEIIKIDPLYVVDNCAVDTFRTQRAEAKRNSNIAMWIGIAWITFVMLCQAFE